MYRNKLNNQLKVLLTMNLLKKKKNLFLISGLFIAIFSGFYSYTTYADDTNFQSVTTVKTAVAAEPAPVPTLVAETTSPVVEEPVQVIENVIIVNSDDQTVEMGILEWASDKYHLVTVKSLEYMEKWSKKSKVEEAIETEGKSEPTSQEN